MHIATPRRAFPSTTAVLVLGLFAPVLSSLGLSAAVQVEQWDTHEITLAGPSGVGNPFVDVTSSGTCTHADGTAITVNGFYDGNGSGSQDGNVWKVRFMPTQLGTWRWTTVSNDPGLDGRTGTIECVTLKKPFLHGPIRVQGYHFVHADGTPRFLISTRLTCQVATTNARMRGATNC
jgi:hypothetical protein